MKTIRTLGLILFAAAADSASAAVVWSPPVSVSARCFVTNLDDQPRDVLIEVFGGSGVLLGGQTVSTTLLPLHTVSNGGIISASGQICRFTVEGSRRSFRMSIGRCPSGECTAMMAVE